MTKIIAVITAIKTVWDLVGQVAALIIEWIRTKRQKEREDKLKEVTEAIKKPNKTVEETANAACKVEKVFNPGSDCDSANGK